MIVTLDEAKLYLRIDSDDEDSLVTNLIGSAEALCKDVQGYLLRSLPSKARQPGWQSSMPLPICMSTGSRPIIMI